MSEEEEPVVDSYNGLIAPAIAPAIGQSSLPIIHPVSSAFPNVNICYYFKCKYILLF